MLLRKRERKVKFEDFRDMDDDEVEEEILREESRSSRRNLTKKETDIKTHKKDEAVPILQKRLRSEVS